jgi:hypothetical protein
VYGFFPNFDTTGDLTLTFECRIEVIWSRRATNRAFAGSP